MLADTSFPEQQMIFLLLQFALLQRTSRESLTAEPPRPTCGPPGDDSDSASSGEKIPGL